MVSTSYFGQRKSAPSMTSQRGLNAERAEIGTERRDRERPMRVGTSLRVLRAPVRASCALPFFLGFTIRAA
jgi:hypothetical protein